MVVSDAHAKSRRFDNLPLNEKTSNKFTKRPRGKDDLSILLSWKREIKMKPYESSTAQYYFECILAFTLLRVFAKQICASMVLEFKESSLT